MGPPLGYGKSVLISKRVATSKGYIQCIAHWRGWPQIIIYIETTVLYKFVGLFIYLYSYLYEAVMPLCTFWGSKALGFF